MFRWKYCTRTLRLIYSYLEKTLHVARILRGLSAIAELLVQVRNEFVMLINSLSALTLFSGWPLK